MKNFAKLMSTALMIGCLAVGIAGCGGSETKEAANVKQTVIYTNAEPTPTKKRRLLLKPRLIKTALKANTFFNPSVLPNWAASWPPKAKTSKLTL